jgi:hypothetical protein
LPLLRALAAEYTPPVRKAPTFRPERAGMHFETWFRIGASSIGAPIMIQRHASAS